MKHLIPALALGAAVVAGCAAQTPVPVAYDSNLYAAAVCVDHDSVRVPDSYCPIGDDPVPGYPFHWVYSEYPAQQRDVDVVYVGYPVDRVHYVAVRPARIATLNIDRGRFPERAAPGTTGTSYRLPSAPVVQSSPPTSTVQRGGLGVPSAPAAGAPQPNRNLNSPAPGRAAAKPPAPPAPRATPPRASGARPVASSSTRAGR